MIRKSLTALSAALLLTTSMAQARVSDRYDAETKAATKLAFTQEQDGWWGGFEVERAKSGIQIVDYIKKVSESNPEAAMWFLLTGGKWGFANRQATEEETKTMVAAMGNIARHFQASGLKAAEKFEDVAKQTLAGQAHLDMIYGKIDALEKANAELEANLGFAQREIALLKEQQTEDRRLIGTLQQRLDQERAERQRENAALQQRLDQERADRQAADRAREAADRAREQQIREETATRERLTEERNAARMAEMTRLIESTRAATKGECDLNLNLMRELMVSMMTVQKDSIEDLRKMVTITQAQAQASAATVQELVRLATKKPGTDA